MSDEIDEVLNNDSEAEGEKSVPDVPDVPDDAAWAAFEEAVNAANNAENAAGNDKTETAENGEAEAAEDDEAGSENEDDPLGRLDPMSLVDPDVNDDGGRSFRRYRNVDLFIWAVMAFGFEMLTNKAAGWFSDQPFALSPTFAVVAIVMMRWNGWAVIHAAVSGAAYCFALGGETQDFVIYCVGNCFMLLGLVFLKGLGKEKVRKKWYFSALYAVIVFVFAIVGRWIVGLFFGKPADGIIDFALIEILSLMFCVLVTLISRQPDGVFEDQKAYIIRTDEERRAEENEDYI